MGKDERYIEADKGIDIHDLEEVIQDRVMEMLNLNFEAVDGTLNSDVEVIISIEEVPKSGGQSK